MNEDRPVYVVEVGDFRRLLEELNYVCLLAEAVCKAASDESVPPALRSSVRAAVRQLRTHAGDMPVLTTQATQIKPRPIPTEAPL